MFERKKPVGRVVALPAEQIEPSPFQARRTFDEAELAGLAASIRENGLLQPVTVRRLGPDRYELVAGERRLRACKLAGMEKIPAIIRDCEDHETAALGLLVVQADLNPFEQARGLQDILALWDCTQAEAARRLGMAQPTLANKLRLLQLTPDQQKFIIDQLLREKEALIERSFDQGKIVEVPLEPLGNLRGVGDPEVQPHPAGVFAQKPGDHAGQHKSPGGHRRPQLESRNRPDRVADQPQGALLLVGQQFGLAEQHPARLRKFEPPTVPPEEFRPKFPLQPPNLAGHVRLGHAERRRRAGEVAERRRHPENPQFRIQHRLIPLVFHTIHHHFQLSNNHWQSFLFCFFYNYIILP